MLLPALFIFIAWVLPVAAGAQAARLPARLTLPDSPEPVIITADTVSWMRSQGLLELSGNVVIEHPAFTIRAERVSLKIDDSVVKASGNVTVTPKGEEEAGEALAADEVEINVEKETGWMARARLTLESEDTLFRFEGERAEKIGENTYLVRDGTFTWCQCREGEEADWSVGAKEISADTEGDAVIKGARIYLRGVPVMLVPYFRYPVGTDRRSGFLFPVIETSSSDGVHFELPYYQVINRSMDATLYPRYIQERGIDLGGEFRYNFGEMANGEIRAFGIDDSQEHRFRGGIRIEHRTEIGDMFTAAADIPLITDNEAIFDFDHRGMGDDRQVALESRLLLALHWPAMNVTTEFAAFDDLAGGELRDSPLGDDRDLEMVQRLPAVTYTLLTTPIWGPFLFDVEGYAVNYYRQEADLGRGQMVSIMPRLAFAYRAFNAVETWASVGYRGWLTAPDPEFDGEATATGRPEAELYFSSQWERIFQSPETVMRHGFRPSVLAFYGGEPAAPEDEFFSTIVPDRATGLAGIHLESRLWTRPVKERTISEMSRVELTQLYDFEDGSMRDLRIEGRLGSPTPWRLNLDAYHSWEEWEWSRVKAGVGYRFARDTEVGVGYRYDSGQVRSPYFDFITMEDEAVYGDFSWRIQERHFLEYRAHYSFQYDRVIRQSLEYDYLARQKCWGVNFRVTDRVKPEDPEGDHEIGGSVNLRITDPSG